MVRAATQERIPALLGELAATQSGVAFVYRCLEAISEQWGVRDAVAVVEQPPLGRQAFRVGRRAPDEPWSAWHAAHARPGIYTAPRVTDADDDMAAIASLCQLALRLDLARYDSLHDALTGLYNRRCFEDMLAQAAGRSRRYGWAFSLVLLDLDGFKKLNDRLGHDAGDAVLRAIGNEMRQMLRRGDVAARIGGDEFAIILPSTEADFIPSLLERLRRGLEVDGEPRVGFSVGIVSCPQEAEEPATLRRIADQRLYQAKVK
jgi:diguanylate cyclase (GGDEF)-like protein